MSRDLHDTLDRLRADLALRCGLDLSRAALRELCTTAGVVAVMTHLCGDNASLAQTAAMLRDMADDPAGVVEKVRRGLEHAGGRVAEVAMRAAADAGEAEAARLLRARREGAS